MSSHQVETPLTKVLHAANTLQGDEREKDLVTHYRSFLKKNAIHGPQGILLLSKDDWNDLKVPIGDKAAITSAAQNQVHPIAEAALEITTRPTMRAPLADTVADAIIDQVRAAGDKMKSHNTLRSYVSSMDWYKNTFRTTISDDTAGNIVKNVCEWVMDKANDISATSKRGRLQDIKAILKMQDGWKALTEKEKQCFSDLLSLLSKQQTKDRNTGVAVGWIAFSDLDFRHMLNYTLYYYGNLPDSELQTVHNLLMGKVTGRRSGEVNSVAASSWSIKFFQCKDATFLRTMKCIMCFKKNHGIGQFPICFAESKDECTEVNLVVITLLLLERKKMIKSAFAVYDGKEDLVIDSKIFETPHELVSKLTTACKKMKETSYGKILELELDDDNEDLPDHVSSLLRDFDNIDGKIPFYTKCHQSHSTSIRIRTKESRTLDFGRFAGWTPTRRLRFGGTCARKGCRQDAKSLIASKVSRTTHLTHQMGHTSDVAFKHYEDFRTYNATVPANLLQASTDAGKLEEFVAETNVLPSFENPEFFNQDRRKFLEPLESAREFLEKHAAGPNSKPEAAHLCFGDGCGRTFLFWGDFLLHSSECTSTSFCCGWCKNYKSTNYRNLKSHLEHCNQRPAGIIRIRKPSFSVNPFLCGCGKTYKNQNGLTKHKKICNGTPTIDVVSANRFPCGCGRSYKHKKHLARHKKDCAHEHKAKKARIDDNDDEDRFPAAEPAAKPVVKAHVLPRRASAAEFPSYIASDSDDDVIVEV